MRSSALLLILSACRSELLPPDESAELTPLAEPAPNPCAACAATELCVAERCEALLLNVMCGSDTLVVVHGQSQRDNVAGDQLGAALAQGCGKPLKTVPQSDPSVIDQLSGQPITGPGTLLVFAGGSYFQRGMRYLETQSASTQIVASQAGADYVLRERATGAVLVQASTTAFNGGHDFFVVEMVKEPLSSSLALTAWGVLAPGTSAAAWYVATHMISHHATLDKRWYVVEWTDGDGDGAPSEGDTYLPLASG